MRFPSGFEAEFRKMQGGEVSNLANASDQSILDSVIGVMRSTWTKTIDPGPYTHADGDATPQFDKILSGDVVYALIAFAATNIPNGSTYRFPVQCPRKHRDRQYQITIDLVKRLLEASPEDADRVVLRPLSKSAADRLRSAGNRFDDTLAARRVVYKLQTPGDQKVTRDLLKLYPGVKDFTPAEQLAVQCLEIEGLKSNSIRERYEFMKATDSTELYALYERVVAQDCGIDTAIQVACPVCDWEQEVELPFDRLYSPRKT